MRSILLSVFLIVATTYVTAQSQTQPFAPAGAKWWYNTSHGGDPNTPFHDFITITAEKDTIISGNLCSKLTTPYGPEFLCRDKDRVYVFDGLSWNLLMDFTSQPGDTLWFMNGMLRTYSSILVYPWNYIELTMVVDSIVARSFAGRNQRMLFGKSLYPAHWTLAGFTEHMGGMGALFGHPTTIDLGYNSNYFLRCFSDSIGTFIKAPFDSLGCDYRQFRVGILEVSKVELSVSPNPASGPLMVTLPENLTTAATLALYNPLGQQVQCTPTVPGQAQRFLSVHGLPAGMYFLTLEGPAGVLARAKVVKK